jgi:hypothetical protein
MEKVIIVGDSHVFYMSGDPRSIQFLNHLNATGEDLFPPLWTSFYNNLEDDSLYCWTFALGARRLNAEILEKMLTQDSLIKNALIAGAVVVFAFGVMEMGKYIKYRNDMLPAVEKYFNAVSDYCYKNNIKFRFASPLWNQQNADMVDEFCNRLSETCKANNLNEIITYKNSDIPYKTYESSDIHHHPSFSVLRNASRHILKSI